MWLRRRLSCCIFISLLVSFGFILNKNSVECRGKKPVGYKKDNVFGCKCGMGIEGPRGNDVRRIVRKRREFDSEEVKNLTLYRSKRFTVSQTDRVVNGYDPNERAWMVFMKTHYNDQEWAYDADSLITNIHDFEF